MYDVIIVGARVAGASLAYFMGLYGYRVLLMDIYKEWPGETVSTHIIGETEVYDRLGIREQMDMTGAPPMTRMRVDVEGHVLESDIWVTTRALGIRRELLDRFLLEAAESLPAVETRFGARVISTIERNGKVVGITYMDCDGVIKEVHGKVVVGADGRNSTVAREQQAHPLVESIEHHLAVRYTYALHIQPLPIPTVEWYWHGKEVVICNPIDFDMHCIAWMAEEERFAQGLDWKDLVGMLSGIRTLAPRLKGIEPVGRIKGIGSRSSFIRPCFGDGWVLVGDASAYLHPIAGVGIDNAVCMAEVLSKALHDYFTHRKSWTEAATDYARSRDERIRPQFEACLQTLSQSISPLSVESHDSLRMLCTFPSQAKKLGRRASDIAKWIAEGNHDSLQT